MNWHKKQNMKKKLLLVIMAFAIISNSFAQNCWQKVSSVSDSYLRIVKTNQGNYLCNAANPNSQSIVNTLYQSTDLVTWSPTNTALASQTHLAFGKDKQGNLFMSSAHNGLYLSNNNGTSWSVTLPYGYGCGALDFDADSLNTLFATVGGSSRGLYVSSNNGANWTNKIPGNDYTDIECVNETQQTFACNSSAIWVSNDHGSSWSQITGQPFSNNTAMIKHIGSNIYVFSINGNIYKSTNNGSSWSYYGNIPLIANANSYLNDAIFISSTWWAGFNTQGLWRSTDNGITWSRQDSCLSGDFHYLFKDGSNLMATTSNGIYRLNIQSCTTNTITPDGPTTFCAGNYVNLTSDVVGGTYQWKKNGVNISTNGTSRTYKATATGSYTCVATCNGTALTSNAIAVTSKTNAFASVTASGATSFCAGDSVTLNCTNLGSNYSVQWYRTNISMENATNYSLVVKQPGTYKVVTKNLTTGCSRISGSAITTSVNCRIAGNVTSGTTSEENNTNEARLIDNELSHGVHIYPNPNNGSFSFTYEGEETGDGILQIINTMGQSIYSSAVSIQEGGYTQEINLGDNYTKGFYIVRLLINDGYNDSRVMVR
jgi:hypothetical protein